MRRVESLDDVNGPLRHIIVEKLVEKRIHLRGGKCCVDQRLEGAIIDGRKLRRLYELVHRWKSRHAKNPVTKTRGTQSLAHDGVQIVGKRQKPCVIGAPIERVIIANTVGQTGLLIVEQRVDGHVFHPLLHVDALLDIVDIIPRQVAVLAAQHGYEIDEV